MGYQRNNLFFPPKKIPKNMGDVQRNLKIWSKGLACWGECLSFTGRVVQAFFLGVGFHVLILRIKVVELPMQCGIPNPGFWSERDEADRGF